MSQIKSGCNSIKSKDKRKQCFVHDKFFTKATFDNYLQER